MEKTMNHFQALSTFTDKLDFIGDIHGCYYTLTDLLTKMGYKEVNGIWQHPQRIAVFVGDYIDRGSNIAPTLRLIKNMVDNGKALAILGNHEYNFIGIFSKDKNGNPLRSLKKLKQHYATIKALSSDQEIEFWIEWFKNLPLFLDFGKIRTIHAAWRDDYINIIKKFLPDNKLDNKLIEAFDKSTVLNKALIYSLKGPELPLHQDVLEDIHKINPDFHQKEVRIKWWSSIPSLPTYEQATTIKYNKKITSSVQDLYKPYPQDAPILIFGHYSMIDYPRILRNNLTCIDFAVYKKNFLAAYRYNGEDKLLQKNLIWVKHNPKDLILPPPT